MAKTKRKNIGALYKSKDPTKPNYVKLTQDITLKAGTYINAESQKFQLANLEVLQQKGILTGENLEKARERVQNMPEFVIAELIVNEPTG